jgi:hypothetical protein
MSRVASEESSATRTAAAAAAQTPARVVAEIEAIRFFVGGATYSLGSGSSSLLERNSGTEFFE